MDRRVLISILALSACGDDEPSELDASLDARVQEPLDAQLDAQRDSQLDAALDASAPYVERTGYACPLDQDYAYLNGVPPLTFSTKWSYALERGGRFVSIADNTWKVPAPLRICAYDLPACGSDKVDGEDLAAALSDPDVLAAFRDQLTVGGSVGILDDRWTITRADGKRLMIGKPCADAGPCVPIPPAVEALRGLLLQLIEQSSDPMSCRDVWPDHES